jgi:endonuclease/exonuclease/phosphatase family metal-dependent hydrolase
MHLRILTLNVWNEEGDPRRLERINRELAQLDPDIIALQEVIQTPEQNQLGKLLKGLNLHSTHQAEVIKYVPLKADRYGGSVVATRWPHQIVEVLDLRLSDATDVPWCTLAASIPLPDLGNLLFIATTTSWRFDAESARERQVVALSELDARHRRTLPTIIAGDFSTTPDAASIRYLTGLQSIGGRSVHYHDAWAVAGEGPGYTWTADNPNARSVMDQILGQPHQRRRVDYVFVGSRHVHPKAHCRIRTASLAFNQPTDGIWASDHFAVVVDLDVGNDP